MSTAHRPAASSLLLILLAGAGSAPVAAAQKPPPLPAVAPQVAGGARFEANVGQFDARVAFVGHGGGSTSFLTADGAVFSLPLATPDGAPRQRYALAMHLEAARSDARFVGETLLTEESNYFIGDDPDRWHIHVPHYRDLREVGVLPGVDLVWHGLDDGAVRYDFELAAGADPAALRLRFDGAQRLRTDADGSLLIDTPAGTLRQSPPRAFQGEGREKSAVASRYVVDGDRVGFAVEGYDHRRPLLIDPTVALNTLAYASYLGGTSNDQAFDIAVGPDGSMTIVGTAISPLFPTTAGAFDVSQNGNGDIFVARLDASGTELIYSTFIGGSGDDQGRAIKLDGQGNPVVTGYSTSPAYPVTSGAYDTTANGSADVVVTKLAANGASLLFSTYVGGSAFEEAFDLDLDTAGNVYVTGRSNGGSFPTTAGAIDTSFNGVADVIVFKLDSSGGSLVYSTYLGGDANDYGEGIAVDAGGNAYVTGFTAAPTSTPYPTTAGAFQTTYQGGTNDMFVSRLNASGTALSYSTFVGGTDSDSANDIAVDATGSATIIGNVLNGGGFPVTVGAYDTTHNGALDVVVARLNSTGSALLFSTYIGGTGSEVGNAISLDAGGNPVIAGFTINSTTNFPTTAGAYQTTHAGGHDGFVAKLSATGTALLYSTLFGGSGDDDINGIALDGAGNAYVAGQTASGGATPLPTTFGAQQSTLGGGQDAFVAKFGNFAISGRVVDTTTGNGVPNVLVSLSGTVAGSQFSGPDGRFGFTSPVDFGAYTVTAAAPGEYINPNRFDIPQLDYARSLVFQAQAGLPTAIADLAVSKSDGVTAVVQGDMLTYTTLASNLAGGSAVDATVTDLYPAALTCSWTCVGVGGGSCSPSGSGSIADAVHLPAGGSAIYTAHCQVAASASGTLASTAAVAAAASVADPQPANNSVTDVDTVLPRDLFRDGFE